MRKTLAMLTVMAALVGTLTAPASAAAPPPPGAISDNVEFIANVATPRGAISAAFLDNTMFVSTMLGLYSYDISDPAAPKQLGALPMYLWENEDMSIDPVRKRVFLSRDPRGFTTAATPGATFPYGAVHIIDVSNPLVMTQVGFFTLPAGHTTTCVNSCDFVWTGGPYANAQTQPGFTGRPIYATDVRDPANPKPCPSPIDLGRNDGVTDYAHDVQVDESGVAWVSGAGGIRGYWTDGVHRNPLTGADETATPCAPVPYGGGGTPNEATPSRFMHNAWRPASAQIPGDDDSKGMVLYGTEENITSNCATSGRFATYDVRGSLNGEGFRNIAETKFRMKALDTWTPEQAPGSTGCASAHYLDDRGDGLLAYSFYGQGTRFLDASDPTDIRQVGYFRPNGGSSFATYWRGDYVFVTDSSRGVDILKFTDGGSPAAAPTVTAPTPTAPLASPAMDSRLAYLCPLPL